MSKKKSDSKESAEDDELRRQQLGQLDNTDRRLDAWSKQRGHSQHG